MHFIQLGFLSIFISMFGISLSYADILMYQCKMKDGHYNFTDTPCKTGQKTVDTRLIRPLAETHTETPQYIPEETRIVYPRYESNEIIDSQRRKEADRERAWNNLGPIGSKYIR